jgi:fatty-acyl-CoA synthase
MPDDVVFVESLPRTATGKLLKIKLREDYRSHLLPGYSPPSHLQEAREAVAQQQS